MDREAFLSRVREAARAGRKFRVATQSHAREEGYATVEGDLLDRLVLEIQAVGGQPRRVADAAAARDAVAQLLVQYGVKTAIVWQHPLLAEIGIPQLLVERGISDAGYNQLAAQDPGARRQTMLAADIGITSADYAIAESGTLALLSRPGQERVTSLLPPVHVAIVERGQVLADLFDLFDRLEPGDGADAQRHAVPRLPSNLVLITGPSKTGDIELRLTTGVHGPRNWHVIVVG